MKRVVQRHGHPFLTHPPQPVPAHEAAWRARALRRRLDARRSVRMFSDRPVPREVVADLIAAASTAPSGAHRQPWTFVAVGDPALKRQIREAAEEEERKNYGGRMPPAWLQALAPLGTDAHKPHLTEAPWVVVCFAQKWGVDEAGEKVKHYYVRESVGMACGLFVGAAHLAGLATLTHTPSPMAFLKTLLGRPDHEQAYVVLPLGWPAEDCVVPHIHRKPVEEVAVFLDGS